MKSRLAKFRKRARTCKSKTKPASTPAAISVAAPSLHDWFGHTTKEGLICEVHRGDCVHVMKSFDSDRFQCAVTSPPYFWQRDYKVEGQIGLEKDIDGYVSKIIECMDEVKRVLKKDGVLFLNLGDTYYSAKGMPRGDDRKNKARRFGLRAVDASGLGVPRKTIIGLPWRIALGMIAKGWILRAPIIWQRHNSLPEPTAKDRPWRTYEFVFLFSKSPKYSFAREELNGQEDVWKIPVQINSSNGVHSAAYPEALAGKCIMCGSKESDEILDPFAGSGTTIVAAVKAGRRAVGIDLSPEYYNYMVKRLGAL